MRPQTKKCVFFSQNLCYAHQLRV